MSRSPQLHLFWLTKTSFAMDLDLSLEVGNGFSPQTAKRVNGKGHLSFRGIQKDPDYVTSV